MFVNKAFNTKIDIEASQIYAGGGVVLLELLIKYASLNNIPLRVYIGYDNVYKKLFKYQSAFVELKKTSILKTFVRYIKRRKHVLFFCNLPPLAYCENSLLYIHNLFYVQKPIWSPKDASLGLNIRKYLYHYWICRFINNIPIVACQTDEMKRLIKSNYNKEAFILPFFEQIGIKEFVKNKKVDFFYPASAGVHKNIIRLLRAVEVLSLKRDISLALTIRVTNVELLELIQSINNKRGKEIVVNLGEIGHQDVITWLMKSKALIFPSLKESLGLPLIESLQLGIPVLASDLPYTYDIISNPITFNPYDYMDIATKMSDFIDGKYASVKQNLKLSNKIDCIFDLLNGQY